MVENQQDIQAELKLEMKKRKNKDQIHIKCCIIFDIHILCNYYQYINIQYYTEKNERARTKEKCTANEKSPMKIMSINLIFYFTVASAQREIKKKLQKSKTKKKQKKGTRI